MKIIKYIRVSTEAQDFAQQENTINRWLENHIKVGDEVLILKEKCSGAKSYTERKLASVFDIADAGDIILFSEFSRIGRSMTDLVMFVKECQRLKYTLIEAKSDVRIDSDEENISSKCIVFALGLAAEIELRNIKQRVRSSMQVRKQRGDKFGFQLMTETTKKIITKKGVEAHKRNAKKRLTNEYNTKLIRIWDLFHKGNDFTWCEMVDYVNKEGILTPTGLPFTAGRLTARMQHLVKNGVAKNYGEFTLVNLKEKKQWKI